MAARKAKREMPLTPEERRLNAQRAAYIGVAKRGPKAMNEQMNRGKWEAFEKQVNEMFPGLYERDYKDFAARAKALQKAQLVKARAGKAAKTAAAEASCPKCYDESGDIRRPHGSDHFCAKHQRAWDRQFKQMVKARGLDDDTVDFLLHVAEQKEAELQARQSQYATQHDTRQSA